MLNVATPRSYAGGIKGAVRRGLNQAMSESGARQGRVPVPSAASVESALRSMGGEITQGYRSLFPQSGIGMVVNRNA